MVIRFNIPNGRMEINAETFFRGARKSQIRKMLKQLRNSWPNEEQVREIRKWLEERIQEEKSEARNGFRRKKARRGTAAGFPVSWWKNMYVS